MTAKSCPVCSMGDPCNRCLFQLCGPDFHPSLSLQVPHGILAHVENPISPEHLRLALGGGEAGLIPRCLQRMDGPYLCGEEMTHIKQTELRLEMLPSWGGGGGWLGGHWRFKKITLRAQESSLAFKGLLDH